MAMFQIHCCLLPVACYFMVRLSRFASCYFLFGVWCSFRCRRCFHPLVAAGAFFIRLVAAGTLFVTLSQVFLLYRCRLFRTLVRLLFSRLLCDSGRECRIGWIGYCSWPPVVRRRPGKPMKSPRRWLGWSRAEVGLT